MFKVDSTVTVKKILDLLAFIDISRRNVERALKAENYYSAAFLSEEMSREAMALSQACNTAGKQRTQKRS